MKTMMRAALCCAALLVFAASASAQKTRRPSAAWGVPQIFSNLTYGTQSGDVGGMEVILVPGDAVDWAVVMIAEGVPGDPVLVKATVNGSNLEFTLPDGGGSGGRGGKYKGRISPAGLTLTGPDGARIGLLRRQRSE